MRKELTFCYYDPIKAKEVLERTKSSRIHKYLKINALNLFPNQSSVKMLTQLFDLNKRSVILLHEPGAGKTLAAAGILVNAYALLQNVVSVNLKVVWVSYTPLVFVKQVGSFVEMPFHSVGDFIENDGTNQFLSPTPTFDMSFKGYRKLAMDVFTIHNEPALSDLLHKNYMVDPGTLIEWAINAGHIEINVEFVESIRGAVLVLDEAHKLQSGAEINNHALAIYLLFTRYDIFLIYISATPMNKDRIELAFIQTLLLANDCALSHAECFDGNGGLIQTWKTDIIPRFTGRVFYSKQPPAENRPELIYDGTTFNFKINNDIFKIGEKMPMKFIPTGKDVRAFEEETKKENLSSYLFCMAVKKAWIYDKESLLLAYRRNKVDVEAKGLHVIMTNNATRPMHFHGDLLLWENLRPYAPKIAHIKDWMYNTQNGLFQLLLGNGIIYTSLIEFPGIDFLLSVLTANGYVVQGEYPTPTSVCLRCLRRNKEHAANKQHSFAKCCIDATCFARDKPTDCPGFAPIYVWSAHAYTDSLERTIERYTATKNKSGMFCKILVASNVIKESFTINNAPRMLKISIPNAFMNSKQLNGRIARPWSLSDINMEEAVVCQLVCTNGDVDNPTKEEVAAGTRYIAYMHILQIISSLIDLSLNLESLPPLKSVELDDSRYYASGMAFQTMQQLCAAIKSIFGVLPVLTKATLYELVASNEYFVSTANYSRISESEVYAALTMICQNATWVDPRYMKSPIGWTVLYQMTSVNYLMHNGEVCHIRHLGNDVYSAVPINISPQFRQRPFLSITNSKKIKTSTLVIKDVDTFDVGQFIASLVGFTDTKFLYYINTTTKANLYKFIRHAIEHWEGLDPNSKKFLWCFVKTWEVMLNCQIYGREKNTDNVPCGYLYNNEVILYNEQKKTWSSDSVGACKPQAMENKVGYIMFINESSESKVIRQDRPKNPKDGRRDTNGKKCVTLSKDESMKIYHSLVNDAGQKPKHKMHTSQICSQIMTIFTSLQFKEWTTEDFVAPTTNEYVRFIFFLKSRR